MKQLLAPLFLAFLGFSCGTPEPEIAPLPGDTPVLQDTHDTPPITEETSNTFEYQEGDTTYVMKEYFMVFLNEGPVRDQDSVTSAQIQAGHLNHLDSLAKLGKIDIVGPFGDDGKTRGIAIYRVPTIEEARSLAEADPAVLSGRLVVEVRPWWCAVGSKLN